MNKIKKKDLENMIFLHNQKKFVELQKLSKILLKLYPANSVTLIFLGLSFYGLKNYLKSIKIFNQAIDINPHNIDAYINLGNAYSHIRDYQNAKNCLIKALTISPKNYKIFYNLGIIYEKTKQLTEAISYYRKAILYNTNYAIAYNNLGNIFQSQGQIKEAKKNFKKAINIDPSYAEAYRHLGRIEKYKTYNSQIKIMENIFFDTKTPDRKKIHIGFALGEAFSNIKKYHKSFYYFKSANDSRRREFSYSINEDLNLSKEIRRCFKNNKLKNITINHKYKTTPIFVVGMLRSGTTLVEQILSSHSKIFGAGEITNFIELTEKYFPQDQDKKFKNLLNMNLTEKFSALGIKYINFIKKLSNNSLFVTDKLPLNFMWIGFIILSIPNAKIINCVRNPIDNCFSIYKNYFVQDGNKYSYNLNELAQFYKIYKDMMKFWHSLFPNYIYDISYESLVKNQKLETKNLLSKCNLNFEESCLKFYENNREIDTASSYQVRQPIYKNSIDYWKNYKKDLLPLIKELNL